MTVRSSIAAFWIGTSSSSQPAVSTKPQTCFQGVAHPVRDVVLREAVLTHVVHRLGALVAVVPIPVWGHRREQLARLHLLLEIEEPEIDQLLRDWDQLGHLTLRGLARLFVVGAFDASLP